MSIRSNTSRRHRGFTLVELMISVFLMLIVMIGVNQIFSVVTSLISTGGALTAMYQNARTALPIIADDFRAEQGINQPWIYINSQQQTAFMDLNDQVSDEYFNINGSGSTSNPVGSGNSSGAASDAGCELSMLQADNGSTQIQLPRAIYGQRSHRVDFIQFFASGRFRSMDSHEVGMQSFGSPVTATDAFINYGMCRIGSPPAAQPWNAGTTYNSGNYVIGTDHNYYHSNFTNNSGGNGIYNVGNNPVGDNGAHWVLGVAYGQFNSYTTGTPGFYARNWALGRRVQMLFNSIPTNPVTNLPYTGYNYPTGNDIGNLNIMTVPQNSRYLSSGDHPPDGSGIYDSHFDMELATIDVQNALTNADTFTDVSSWGGNAWYSALTQYTKPITPSQINLSSPAFLKNCSSFAVEFAGDYVSQFPDGLIKPTIGTTAYGPPAPTFQAVYSFYYYYGPDGVTDFYIDPVSNAKKIRWYGLPRDTNGDGQILQIDSPASAFPGTKRNIALSHVPDGTPVNWTVNGVTTSDQFPGLPAANNPSTIPILGFVSNGTWWNNVDYTHSLQYFTNPNYLTDVLPIRDIVNSTNDIGSFELIKNGGNTHAGSIQTGSICYPYEGTVTNAPLNAVIPSTTAIDYADPVNGMGHFVSGGQQGHYGICFRAGKTMPTMIRFIITLEDPSGKSASHTYEYVMNVR